MESISKDTCVFDKGEIKCPILSEPRKIFSKDDLKIKHSRGKELALSVSRDKIASIATKKAIDGIGGMCNYVKKDDVVLVKLNITGGISTNKASFTNPDVAKEVVKEIKECGGKVFVADSSMIWTDLHPIAKKQGYDKWAKENGVELVDLHNLPIIPFDFGEDSIIGVDKASRVMLDADVLITIPKIKTHMLTTNSLGLKNNYGLLARADKGVYHAKGIDETIAETNYVFPTTLTIIDGTIAGEGESGPLTPIEIKDYNLVIASNDIVCGDSVASVFMGFDNPMKIRHLKNATYMGVGDGKCYKKDKVKDEIKKVYGTHEKDGNFILPDPNVIESLTDTTKNIARNPGGSSLLSNLADMFLGNLSYYNTAFMQSMLIGFTKLQKRYLGNESLGRIHGFNLHPEDEIDNSLI